MGYFSPTLTVEDGPFRGVCKVSFPYNKGLGAMLKHPIFTGCLWNKSEKHWTMPLECAKTVFEKADEFGLERAWKAKIGPVFSHVGRNDLHWFQTGAAKQAAELGYYMFNFEMGCGKTAAAIEALKLRLKPRAERKILVVCPAMVRNVWFAEFEKWWPEVGNVRVMRSSAMKNRMSGTEKPYNVKVVSYELLKYVRTLGWDAIVADEAHFSKDSRSQRGGLLQELSEKNPWAIKFALSGTPLAQEPKDLHAQLSFLRPTSFSSWWKFTENFCQTTETQYGREVSGAKNADILKSRLQEFSSRITQNDLKHLLPKVERDTATWTEEEELLKALEPKDLIFTFRKETAHRLASQLNALAVTGEMTQKKRLETLRRASFEDQKIVATMTSCGIGIDLTAYPNVAVVEISPKLSTLRQALGRVVRLNSVSPVVSITFLSRKHSKDEKLSAVLVGKMEEIDKVMRAGATEDVLSACLSKADQDFAALAVEAGDSFIEEDEYGL